MTLNRSILRLSLIALAVTTLAVAAKSQESSLGTPFLPAAPPTQQMVPVPSFRIGDFQLEVPTADDPSPDSAPDVSAGSDQRSGFVKRSLIRIGAVDKSAGFSRDMKLDPNATNRRNLRIAVIVQEAVAGRVWGAGFARLSN